MSSSTLIEPLIADPIIEQINGLSEQLSPSYRVILFNDHSHSMDQVVMQIQKACGYSLEKAEAIMFEAHSSGQAIVYCGEIDDCNRVAGILQQIGLGVTVESM